ncbi:HAAS signaling domain-containing protein [Streptomyces boninensis]|uniref:HAAS signaling domain-containing protein n=1 Tax=Streptomyces boninensis TaxID=2039455 RepID=UPI003B223C54
MTTDTLIERYVREVVQRIPAEQRTEVAMELRATIADAVEARKLANPDADREVLTEMGDPARLADRYADRPPVLIGPALFPVYRRLLTLALTTVLPVITAVFVGLDLVDGKDLGSALRTGLGVVLGVGAQLIAWLTVVFALVERSRGRGRPTRSERPWSPDDLAEIREVARMPVSVCLAAGWNALLLGLIVWQHLASPWRPDSGPASGERIEVLDPGLWSGWIWPVLLGLGGLVAINLVRLAVGAWSVPMVVWYGAAQAAFALPLAWVLSEKKFFNPDFLTDIHGAADAFYTVTALGVLLIAASDTFKRFREATR